MVAANHLYQSVTNFETGTRVTKTLMSYDDARFRRVNAVAFCGIVELSGQVATYFDKLLAIGIAEKVDGVSTVVESIRIHSAGHSVRDGLDSQYHMQAEAPPAVGDEGFCRRFDLPHE
ncbi:MULTISPECIES: BON domain-containing protein [unclassified Schlesneria]|uniref:BON domain-containing protein n=1 Tax=Schlesneria TaxID=656899 RepID=UPI002EF69E85